MTGFGANEDDMQVFAKLSEREMDAILAGRATSDALADVAAFVRELRIDLEEAPPSWVESRHLAGIIAEAGRVRPAAATPQTTSVPRPRRLQNPFRRLAARATITAAGLAALATLGGVAYAGALPAVMQTKVAEIARHVGLSLPDKHRHTKKPNIGPPPTSTSSTPSTPNGAEHGKTYGGQDETQTTNTGSTPAQGNDSRKDTSGNNQSSGIGDGNQGNNLNTTPEQTQGNNSNTASNSDTTTPGTDGGHASSNQDNPTTTDQSGAPQQPQPEAPTNQSPPSNGGGDSGTGSTQQTNDVGNGN